MIQKGNEDGVAYGFGMLAIFMIVLVPVLYLSIGTLVNSILVEPNAMVGEGTLSEQSKSVLDWQVLALSLVPLVTIAGSTIWSINQGVVTRNGGGLIVQAFTGGWVIMMIILTTSFALSFVGVIYMDGMVVSSTNTLADVTDMDESGAWAKAARDYGNYFMNLAYTVLYVLPLLGYAIYFQSAFKRTSGDRYTRGW